MDKGLSVKAFLMYSAFPRGAPSTASFVNTYAALWRGISIISPETGSLKGEILCHYFN
jgi:hypothetical protein